jgi:hypothetical protein
LFAAIDFHHKLVVDTQSDQRILQDKKVQIVMMSDLVKAQNTPQFNWYTRWTSLGADGMPDKLIKEGLKQPNQIKFSFEKGTKEITGHVAPDQAQFGAEYFLAYTLPNFKSKILTRLSDSQKDNGPLLFSLLGQCFQDIVLMEWTSIVAKWCLDDADWTKANFDKCIRDYLEAVAGFLNIGNQLIHWLCTAKKPALMPMHEFMRHRVQLLSYLESDYLRWTMDIPIAQEKSEQIFFAQPKAHQNKFADLNKMVPANLLRMIAFFEQCQASNKAAGILEKIAKDKKQLKEMSTAHVPTAHSHGSSYKQHRCHKYCDYPQSSRRDRNDLQPDYCHRDNWRHDHGWCDDKDARNSKSYNKKDYCKHNHFKKKSDEAMHNDQSSSLSAGSLPGKRSRSWSPSRSRSCSCSRSSSISYKNHHVEQHDHKPSAAPKHGCSYSEDASQTPIWIALNFIVRFNTF